MAIPSVNMFSQQPGGGIVTAMRGTNALSQDMIDTKIKGIQAQYAPLTAQAEAASKLAYANLMGPQFLAKLMGNEDILANIQDPQKRQLLNMLVSAGSGQGTGNALMGGGGFGMPQSQNNSLSDFLVDKIKNVFSQQPQQQMPMQQPQQQMPSAGFNASALSPQDIAAINRMQPGDAYVIQGNQPPQPSSFAENVGSYKGIKEEGQEAGKIRANDIKELSDTVFNGETKQGTLDQITDIIRSPEFEQIRQTPILGHHELSYYAKYGTKEQQNMVGQLMTLSGNVIRDASQDFKGSFRKGEQQLLQNMKINPGDTVYAARGKMEQLSYLNRMITERARMTGTLMNQYHINKLQAEELADKNLKGEEIRNNIHNKLNPKPTEEDINYMAEKYKVTPDEIRKRLKAKGIL